ncbi:MAG: helicase HerA-like domain-containing protein [Pseudomonadota bacterium]|nr:helicase HerA-like domain-containing protein [Pseudomonadota bacterium]
MTQQATLLIGGNGQRQLSLAPRFANRHGLVAGATGTGKTVTLQVLAENFSRLGVPVFMADVKGDLAGISQPGMPHPKVDERIAHIGVEGFAFAASPVVFWDLRGEQGHPIRATVSDMGPLLLARLLDLNDTQEGVLNLAFQVADDEGLLLLDMADLRTLLGHIGDNAATFKTRYGNVSAASIGAIQRSLLVLEREGGDQFFGEPMLDFWDLLRSAPDGRGMVNILAADKLIHSPRLYATFLLWLLSELFENLPEVGDPDKPRLVFFFDEAHLLFNDAPKALLAKIEQVVRLIRSKGVGVYFITQSPLDVPESVLGQLGNRVQHALRAFTPRDQKAVRAAATTFRQNPALDTETAITQLGVGEALVSVLEDKGHPGMVERVLVCPPRSRIGPISAEERALILRQSPLAGRYDRPLDRDSAHEELTRRAAQALEQQAARAENAPARGRAAPRGRGRQSMGEAFAKSVTRTVGSAIGRQIVRGILGSLFKGR